MASANLSRCLDFVFRQEGGYVNDKLDPGGETNMGITIATLAKSRGVAVKDLAVGEVRNLTRAEAERIYVANYWAPLRCEALPSGIDLGVLDYGVNSGPARSAKALQGVLGVTRDGVIGPATLAAAKKAEPTKVIKALCAQRLGFLQALSTWGRFGRGWARRVAEVEATAVAWVLAETHDSHVVAGQLADEASTAIKTSDAQAKGAIAGTVGAGGSGAGIGLPADQHAGWVLAALLVAFLIGAAWLFWRARVNQERASAFVAAAGRIA